ncbi:hypothetical protein [Nonomuraea sp. NPDC002799]
MFRRISTVAGAVLVLPVAITIAAGTPAAADDCKDLAYGVVYNMTQGNLQYAAWLYGLFQENGC